MAAGLRIGRYELGERLGTGGFGVVYHARDTELGRELAIKVLRPEYQTQPDVIARFLKEARAAAKIDHPGIVTVFECGTISGSGTAQDGNAYIAMELLRGYSLTQHLEQRGRLSVADAILIGRQIAAALTVAHAAGIVHRDLKPDNVFLLPDALVKGGFRIKILDFGVAKLAEPKEAGVNTHSQMMLGTPKYMSPEQARSARAVDQRTDIYTLGCMLYEMLTGQAPYEGPGAIDMIIQHTTAPIPSPRAIVQGLPESMDALIRKMLGKEPEDRPDSMKALDKALEEIQTELVPPSGPQRPKPPTQPPAIPRTPARPTPAPPTGLTPTPPVATMRNTKPTPAPPMPPMRPTPPQRPAPVAVGTLVDSAPFSTGGRTLEEEVTTSAEPRTTMRRASASRMPLLVGAGVLAAALAATVMFFALRKTEPERDTRGTTAKTTTTMPLSPDEIARLKQDCEDLEKALFWKELKECSERLKPHDRARADALLVKAVDEAANEDKFKALQKFIAQKDFERARVLVKRITGSVYTDRAHKLLEDAEAPK
ncbi:MAG: serine/threonine protein kinase [Myxococcota bacterium]|nr:serine/threonine protein kinase [Myxococcota bacterium]